MTTRYYLRFGVYNVYLDNPRPEDIDLVEIERRLPLIRRFSHNPKALSVHQHRKLVWALARLAGCSDDELFHAWHHDDHEAIIGDHPSPLLSHLRYHTYEMDRIADRLDTAIYIAWGVEPPTSETRKVVKVFDRLAASLEWFFVLRYEPEDWCEPAPFKIEMPDEGYRALISWAKDDAPFDYDHFAAMLAASKSR